MGHGKLPRPKMMGLQRPLYATHRKRGRSSVTVLPSSETWSAVFWMELGLRSEQSGNWMWAHFRV